MSQDLASLWLLDPAVAYLNHGSFGACPAAVLEAQSALRLEMEREPVAFLSGRLQRRLEPAREALAAFVGAADYTGNAHKWLCAPKGAAFLHVRRDLQEGLHPMVISHGYPRGYRAEFDWTGTCDPTAWLCIPEAIRYLGALLPGGWPDLMVRNHALALQARDLLCRSLRVAAPAPDELLGSMASIPLPAAAPGSMAARFGRSRARRVAPRTGRAHLAPPAPGPAAARLGPALRPSGAVRGARGAAG